MLIDVHIMPNVTRIRNSYMMCYKNYIKIQIYITL